MQQNIRQVEMVCYTPAEQGGRDYIYGVQSSPFGDCILIGDVTDGAPVLAGLGFCNKSPKKTLDDLRKKNFRKLTIMHDESAAKILATYLHNQKPVPLSLAATPFQHKVWAALCQIPQGQTETYKSLAQSLHTSPRAIGRALGANPVAWLIPCHRVLAHTGKLHGYRWGLHIKKDLLSAEEIKTPLI